LTRSKRTPAQRRAAEKARNQRWQREDPEAYRAAHRRAARKWAATHPVERHFKYSKNRAKQHGVEFTLTMDWFRQRYAAGLCELTGLPFAVSTAGGPPSARSPSVDRRNPSKGYTPANCRLILHVLNVAFNTWGEDETEAAVRAWLARRWLHI
jgi:hypothetical protein